MIELIGVEKTYRGHKGSRVVLDHVDAVFRRGDSVGVLGVNGAGKSTLLRILSGAEAPDRGEVRRTVDVSWPLGFSGSFNGSLTGAENLRFVARIYGADIDEVTEFVREFSELGRYMDEPIKTYSTGMRARLAFGLSMAIDFQVYLVDETLGVGDSAFQEKCRKAFEERRARSDIILTSHDMATIKAHCNRAVVLNQGRLYMFDDVESAEDFYNELLAKRS